MVPATGPHSAINGVLVKFEMLIRNAVVAVAILVPLSGCRKVYNVVIVNRYPDAIYWIQADGPKVLVPKNGVTVLVRSLEVGERFKFEVASGQHVEHEVESIVFNAGSGDVYVIDMDPLSKDGAGSGRSPTRPYE